MRSFLAVLAVGLVALLAVGLTQGSSLVYSLGVAPAVHAVQLNQGTRACQGPMRPPKGAAFDRIGFVVAPVSGTNPPVRVKVLDADSGRELASGRLDGRDPSVAPAGADEPLVAVGRVRTDAPLEVCLVGEGNGSSIVMGQPGIASPTTSATLDGKPISSDLAIELHSSEQSLIAWLPTIAERASRFRAGWVTPGVYLVLALAILLGAPFLLARGLARADSEDQSRRSTSRQ